MTHTKRKTVAFIGLQTGDEGKGIQVPRFARRAVELAGSIGDSNSRPVLVERYQGGANAGHTIVIGGVTYKLHQVPSGIVIPGTFNFIREGVFFNPRAAVEEIQELMERGIEVNGGNFGIASNVQITLGYHVSDDQAYFKRKEHTSTGRGIKQTSVDKQGRDGIRLEEFLDPGVMFRALKKRKFPNERVEGFGSLGEFVDSYGDEREALAPLSVLQADIVERHGTQFRIGEGAQGYKLDVDKGLYPGVTSSNSAIVPYRTDLNLGVIKLYESSVGSDRPFVGQMDADLESRVRSLWGEVGTTTGLPRDLGWVDTVALRHAVKDADIDFIVSTCGDRLDCLHEMGEKVKIVVAYEIDGVRYDAWDKSFHNREKLYGATPIFEEFEPWESFTDGGGSLTRNAQIYVDRIEELVDRRFMLHGTGPSIDDYIDVMDVQGVAA
jgi:adenylosuccinate synthase